MTALRPFAVVALAASLAACGTIKGDRIVSGAAVGAGSGAAIGAVAGGIAVAPAAVIGAAVGAGFGAVTDASDFNLGPPLWR